MDAIFCSTESRRLIKPNRPSQKWSGAERQPSMTAAKRMYLNLIKQSLPNAIAPPLGHNRHASYIQRITLRYGGNRTNNGPIDRRHPNRSLDHTFPNSLVRKDGSIKPA